MSLLSRLGELLIKIGGDTKQLRRQAGCNIGGILSGSYYDNAWNGSPTATLVASGHVLSLVPYMTAQAMRIDRMGLVVTVAGASNGLAELYIYECLPNGWPGAKLLTTSQLAVNVTGLREAVVDFTFEEGKTYWLGLRTNVGFSMRGIQMTDAKQFGLGSLDPATSFKANGLEQAAHFSGAAPNNWGAVVQSQLITMVSPSLRMRAV